MIYFKSALAGFGMILLAPIIFYTYVYMTHLRPHRGDGLVGVASGLPEVITLAVVLFTVGAGLMYWHLR